MVDHPLELALYYDGDWHPAPVYTRDGCTIKRGSATPGNDTEPAEGQVTLDNNSSNYAPSSVVSALRGKIGQNTKGRITIDEGAPLHVDPMDGTATDGWGFSPTAGGYFSAWTSGGVANFARAAGVCTHNVTTAGSYRLSYLNDLRIDAPDKTITVTMPLATGGDLEAGILLRGTDTTTYYHLRAIIPTSAAISLRAITTISGVETVLDTVAAGVTHVAATPLHMRARIFDGRLQFKVWQGTQPAAWTLDVNPGNAITRAGWVGIRSGRAGGNTNSVGPQFSYDNLEINYGSVRLTGEVASWRPERAIKNDAWTKIDIAGVLQRIGRGTDPIQSALTRAALALDPVAYWPLEGRGEAITPGTLPLVETRPAGATQIEWSDSAALLGSLPIPTSPADTTASSWESPLSGAAGGASATGWSIGLWFVGIPADAATTSTTILEWGGIPGGVPRTWGLAVGTGPGWVGSEVFVSLDGSRAIADIPVFDGAAHHLMVTADGTTPGSIDIVLYVDGEPFTVGSDPNPATATLVPVDQIYPGNAGNVINGPRAQEWIGGIGVWDRVLTLAEVNKIYDAGLAHSGETAADRFVRFCIEEGVTPTVVGDPAESVVMGPQKPKPRLEVFDEIARTDDASIFETRDGIGLTMRTGVSKLNQAPAVTISYLGQVQPPLTPVFGDLGIRNDVTAASPGGATRRVQQLTGPRNVQLPEDDPQGVGRYQTRIDVNPQTEGALSDAAGWRVNLGTFDGNWYVVITADLDAAPEIATRVAALDIGDTLAVSELPVDEALETVELIIIGIEEDVPPKRRLVTFFCVPGVPYRVGVLAETSGDTDPFVGHLDTDGSTAGAAAAGAAALVVRTTSGPLWTQDGDDCPLDVIADMQRVSISAIGPAVSDPFSRTLSDTWGTEPVTGRAYIYNVSPVGLFGVVGGTQARIITTATGTLYYAAVDVGHTDHTVRIKMALPVLPTGAAFTLRVTGRLQDFSNYYEAELSINTAGTANLFISKRVNGARTQLVSVGSVGTHSAGNSWWIELDVQGSTISAKAWNPTTTGEPSAYQGTTTDGALTTGTNIGAGCRRETGNTNGSTNIDCDDLSVVNPQRFTVGTAGHVVAYPIAARSVVNVQQPVILAQ